MRAALVALVLVFGCAAEDQAPPAPESFCGMPGDTGNELGVGRYCAKPADCAGGAAGLCAVVGDPGATFCTRGCVAGEATCGSAASCQCQGGLCGCVPDSCL